MQPENAKADTGEQPENARPDSDTRVKGYTVLLGEACSARYSHRPPNCTTSEYYSTLPETAQYASFQAMKR